MKYLNKLFAFNNEDQTQQNHQSPTRQLSSATLASSLYSVTFTRELVPRSRVVVGGHNSRVEEEQLIASSPSARYSRNRVTITTRGERSRHRRDSESWLLVVTPPNSLQPTANQSEEEKGEKEEGASNQEESRKRFAKKEERRGLGAYLLTTATGKTIAGTSGTITSIVVDDREDNQDDKAHPERRNYRRNDQTVGQQQQQRQTVAAVNALQVIENDFNNYFEFVNDQEDDWILVEGEHSSPLTINQHNYRHNHCESYVTATSDDLSQQEQKQKGQEQLLKQYQMALDETDVELIRASWAAVKRDPVASGVLLFKSLFTKFPLYLKFFPQFADLDVEQMQENKRLLKHAVKVIETVTFVVDSIGDEAKTDQLNEALVNLVKSHLKRKVGLTEFRNLGIVLIDFICDINQRRHKSPRSHSDQRNNNQLNRSSASDSSDDSETMTSALDKIRASSSPSASSEEDSFVRGVTTTTITTNNLNESITQETCEAPAPATTDDCDKVDSAKLDTNLFVAAWTKLYSGILDLVKREEDEAAAAGGVATTVAV